MKKRKLKLCWSCSDYCHHKHRTKIGAYICGKLQFILHYNNWLFIIVLVVAAVFLGSWDSRAVPTPPLPEPTFIVSSVPDFIPEPAVTTFNKPLFQWPIHEEDYVSLSSPFGDRSSEEIGGTGEDFTFHRGLDLYGTWSARIVAADTGLVTVHYPPPDGYYKGHSIMGGYIEIVHADGYKTCYAHLDQSFVHEGNVVLKGQLIGRQGNSGRSLSPHLHFEVKKDEQYLNPLQYLEEPK